MTKKSRALFVMWMVLGVVVLICAAFDFLLRSFGWMLFGLFGGAAAFWNGAGRTGARNE
jgi:hypothetical protein